VDETKHLTESPLEAFASSIGPGQVRRGRERDAVDGVVPESVVTATSTKDVAVCVAECSKRGLAIVPLGGGTAIRFGNKPARYDTKLSLAGMSRATARNPEDLTVTVDAGIPLSHLNRLLAGDGQRVALDADAAHRSTLGGLAAADHRGRLAFRYGSPRDQILGMTVVDGRGRELRIGGKVVKNVAGYDLTRLFVGSYGTLGVITEITIRTYPVASSTADAVFEFDDALSVDAARSRIFASRLPLAGFDAEADVKGGSGNWRLRCLLEGSAEEVDHQVERIERLAGTPARTRIEIEDTSSFSEPEGTRSLHTDDESIAVRVSANPAAAVSLIERARTALAERFDTIRVDGRLGTGLFRLSTSAGRSTEALAFVRTVEKLCEPDPRARVVTETASAELKSTLDVWGGVVPGFHLMKRIKQKFDPSGILSPGRFVGRL
jgi:glycolate oxidase FAD binding subunit